MSIIFQQAANGLPLTLTGATSASGVLPRPSGNSGPMVATVLNTDAEAIFVKFGASDVEAAATDAAVAAGERAFFMAPLSATHAAVVAVAAGTGVVYIALGYASNAH